MPIGAAKLRANQLLVLHVTASVNNLNLRTRANAAGYSGSGAATIYIDTGVIIGSTTTATAGLIPGTWPSGVTVTLINNGSIRGKGGAGGNGNLPASAGGTALSATGISGYTFSVDNTSGTIRGGGGGGPGGGDGDYGSAGGGGGGQGDGGGAGGIGSPDIGYGAGGNGSAGTNAGAGSGGGGMGGGANGANGGAFGTAGSPSYAGDPYSGIAYAGGAAGNSVTGTANITWIAVGTRTGPVS
jgi:hypothetical protein